MAHPKIGDHCRFSKQFLQSTGQYTGPTAPTSYGPFARGTVIGTVSVPSATTGNSSPWVALEVHWDDDRVTSVFSANLEKCR